MIYILLVLLLIILLLNFLLNNNDIIAPSVLFSFSFTIAVMFASFYVAKWQLNLHMNTFWVIFLGVLEFSVTSLLVSGIFKLFKSSNNYVREWIPNRISITNIQSILVILFEIFTIFYSVYSVVKLYNGSMLHFTSSVNQYRDQNLFGSENTVSLPLFVSYLRLIVEAMGYWFGYILINNYYVTKKVNIYLSLIVLLSGISSYIMGGRNGIITLLIMLVCFWFIISNKEKQFKKTIEFKTIIKLLIIGVVALSSFESLAFLIGRGGYGDINGLDYLAIYIGAPIKNLDIFLTGSTNRQIGFESQTFIHLVNTFGVKFHLVQRPIKLDLPFQHIWGFSLGNVYTTFYAFIYDFGYRGVGVLVFVMALLSQISYEIVKKSKKFFSPAISSLIYAYIGNTLVMSFFSNKFFEQIFDPLFVKMVIVWILLEIIFIRINFVKIGDKKL